MASDRGFVDYILEQLQSAGNVTAKRMFGEYGLFCDGVFFAVICDNQLFVKPTVQCQSAFPELSKAPPYDGAKDYILVSDTDNKELMLELVRITYQSLQEESYKKRGNKNGIV